MTNLAAIVIILSTGIASQYAPHKAQSVIRVRQANRTAMHLPAELPPTDGYIAVLDCAEIGNIWYLRHNGRVESFLVVDCAGDATTRAWMTRNNIIVEVDFETAQRWHTVGRGAKIERVLPSLHAPY